MVSFQNNKSFDETCRNAYSHGLEAIYTLENIDVKSIRKFTIAQEVPSEPTLKPFKPFKTSLQLNLDFGYPFFNIVQPFFLDEPIQSLGLSLLAEKCLENHGKHFIRDLVYDDLAQYAFMRGFGQGHLVELREKLAAFLKGRDLELATTIDFGSWVRVLTAEGDRRKWYLLMDRFGLADLVSLSNSEAADLKKLTPSQKNAWEHQAIELIDQTKLIQIWKNLAACFLLPWMRSRLGVATKQEIRERLIRISEDQKQAEQVIHFMESVLNEAFLISIHDSLYASDPQTASEFCQVLTHAVSYFYKSDAKFTLKQLISWIERDFAKQWTAFPEGFVEKVLRNATEFLVRKDEKGQLLVYLA